MSQRLGEYTIEGVLGEGGSAVVYAARGRIGAVALKVLRVDALTTERQKSRFLDEARLLVQVRHPSVVAVLDAGTLPDGRPFLTMPRLEGETLAARVARGRLALTTALRLFEAIADGVAAIHDAGLVHRDLKAENVFLTDDDRPIVLDLGIAREADAAASITTEDGVVRGTPATMAPERFFGARASTASDVYELALLLYVMLVGALPWSDAGDVDARLSAQPAHTLVATIPRALSDAIMVALSTRIEKRPASVAALLASVREAATREGDARRTSETTRRDAPSATPPPPPPNPRDEAAPREEASRLDPAPTPASTARPHAPAAPRARGARSRVVLGAIAAATLGFVALGAAWRTHGEPVSAPAPGESSGPLGAALGSALVSVGDAASPAPPIPLAPAIAPVTSSASRATPASAPAKIRADAPVDVLGTASAAPPIALALTIAPTMSSTIPGATPSSASAEIRAAALVDELAPCRVLVALRCDPALVENEARCAVARRELRAAETGTAIERTLRALICQDAIAPVTRDNKERLDWQNGRPTSHRGVVADSVLDARFPGCARSRREKCAYPSDPVSCQNYVDYIDHDFNGTPAQQDVLRRFCSDGLLGSDLLRERAKVESDLRRERAKRRDGGAP